MKRSLWFVLGCTAFLGMTVHDASRGQPPAAKSGDIGPGEQGAKLRMPGMDPTPPSPAPKQGQPSSYQNLWNPAASPKNPYGSQPSAPMGGNRVALPPSVPTDVNKDIEITPNAGAWILFFKAYTGPEAPTLARALVMELRTNYKIQAAYIFNYGAEEKRKEYERVQAAKQKQIDDLKKNGLDGKYLPIPIRASKIDEQTGVLIGGYRDRDDALRALAKIRHLQAPDPQRFKLDVTFVGNLARDKDGKVLPELKTQSYLKESVAYVNPFPKAFPARNPSIKHETADASKLSPEDLVFLRKINNVRDEPLSLLACRGKYTLVVKQYATQFKVGSDVKPPPRWFDPTFGIGQPEWKDNAAHNAHNLAEGFRKAGLTETYVLHTKFCSFVTMGGFDSLEDRRLIAMKDLLETRFRSDAYRPLELLPTLVPMLVPH